MNGYYSIIIPFYGNREILDKVLLSLKNTCYPWKEIILVNDGSKCELDTITKRFQCRLINIPERRGPSFARNIGSKEANFENLVFLDSDIIVPNDCFIKINSLLDDKSISAINCLVSSDMPYKNFFSQYANFFFRYSILREAHNMIFTSFCIIKAECFNKIGGFAEHVLYPYADDLILGWKLRHNGCKFAFAKNIEVQHYKRISALGSILYWLFHAYYMEKYFIIYRKVFKYPKPFYKKEGPLSIIAALILSIFLYFGVYNISIAIPIFLMLLIIINYKFLNFISKEKGFLFALKSILIILLQQCIYSTGAVAGIVRGFFERSRS